MAPLVSGIDDGGDGEMTYSVKLQWRKPRMT